MLRSCVAFVHSVERAPCPTSSRALAIIFFSRLLQPAAPVGGPHPSAPKRPRSPRRLSHQTRVDLRLPLPNSLRSRRLACQEPSMLFLLLEPIECCLLHRTLLNAPAHPLQRQLHLLHISRRQQSGGSLLLALLCPLHSKESSLAIFKDDPCATLAASTRPLQHCICFACQQRRKSGVNKPVAGGGQVNSAERLLDVLASSSLIKSHVGCAVVRATWGDAARRGAERSRAEHVLGLWAHHQQAGQPGIPPGAADQPCVFLPCA